MRKLFTSESVTEGHPDKVCDRISDAVLDAVLAKDSEGRVACETCCTTDTVFIAGEITSKVDVDIEGIARRVLRDIGLTGRKIIVDTYGGYAPHGGGAFSGKDPTKVDRSAAYMARHIAKNVVASGLCDKCQVQLAYAIGMALPVSLRIDTFGANVDEEKLCNAVDRCFELTPLGIIDALNLRLPIYEQTSAYGHFGNVTGGNFTWESTHKAGLLRRTYNTL